MKYLTEYRDPSVARGLISRIRELATRRWVLMEACSHAARLAETFAALDLDPPCRKLPARPRRQQKPE